MNLITLYKSIIQIGVTPDLSKKDAQRIVISNRITLILALISAKYIIIFPLFHALFLGFVATVVVLGFLCVLVLNTWHQYTVAKIWMLGVISITVLFFSSTLGPDASVQLVFFGLTSLAFTLFKLDEKQFISLGISLAIGGISILEFTGYGLFPRYSIPKFAITVVHFSAIGATLLIILSSILFLYTELEKLTQLLEVQNKNLNKAKTIIDNDIRAAQIVQRSTIPQKFPQPDGVIITHWYQAARGVGGDFIDGIALDEHRTLIICGDIVGKGIQASLKMAAFYPMFRMLVEGFTDVQDLVLRCSKAVEKFYEFTQYIPCTIALIDSKEQTLTFCNAGHEGGYLLRGDQVIELLTGGPPFGADIDPVYAVETIPLQAGDRLVIFTDGFPDLKNPEGSRLKHQDALRIIKAVHEEVQNAESPEFFVDRVSQEFMVYKDNAPQADDMAIVSIEIGQRKEVQTV